MDFEDNDLLEHGFFFLDDESPSEEGSDASADSDEDEELDKDKLDGLINKAKIEHFNAIFFEAQAMAVKAEHEANGEKPKHKRHYTGNSTRTWQYHAQKRQQLGATGQKFINSWFSKEEKPSKLLPKDAAAEIVEILDNSDASESKDKDEIDACMHHLIPGTAPVSFWT